MNEFESNPEAYINPFEKKLENIEEWKKDLRKKEKERELLTKKALKKQEERQKEMIETKMDGAILNVRLIIINNHHKVDAIKLKFSYKLIK